MLPITIPTLWTGGGIASLVLSFPPAPPSCAPLLPSQARTRVTRGAAGRPGAGRREGGPGAGGPRCRCHGSAHRLRRILGINFRSSLKSEPRRRRPGGDRTGPGGGSGLRGGRRRLAAPAERPCPRPACGLPPGRGRRGAILLSGRRVPAALRRVSRRRLTPTPLLSRFPRRSPCFPSARSRLLASVAQHADRPLTGAMERDRAGAYGDGGERRAGGRSGAAGHPFPPGEPPRCCPKPRETGCDEVPSPPPLATRSGEGGSARKPVAPHPERFGAEGGGGVRRSAPVPPRSGGRPGAGRRCGLPCRPLRHRVWIGTVLRGFGAAVGEGACKTDGNLQSRLSRT